MRQFLIFIIVISGHTSIAQWNPDTTVSKKTLDSLYQELARYKDANKQTYFNQIVSSNTVKIDSLFTSGKDTLIIINYSETSKLLRKQEFHFDTDGCKRLLIDTYFDTTGLRLYQEQWKLGCNFENNITGFLQYRYRYHYDKTNNEIGMTSESFDGGGHRVRYFKYDIDKQGKKTVTQNIKLNQYSFWD